jgi:hypothetical protein
MNWHSISLEEYPYFSSEYVYVAVCSCGYQSGKNVRPQDALRAGQDHVQAKLASPGTPG